MSSKKTRAERRQTLMRALAVVLAVLLIGTVVASVLPLFGLAEEAPARNEYLLNVAVDPISQAAAVEETVSFHNTTGRTLGAIWFNVYPNAQRRASTVPVEYDHWSDAFPAEYAPGGVDFISVTVNGEAVNWAVSGQAECYLWVPVTLEAGESCKVGFRFQLLLTANALPLGVGQDGFRLTNFYPIAAVYDRATEDFILNPCTAACDPLMSEPADYTVNLTAPAGWYPACTGLVTDVTEAEGYSTFHIRAQSVRDAGVMLIPDMAEISGVTRAGLTVHIYGRDAKKAGEALSAAVECMDVYEGWLDPLGLGELEIVLSDVYNDGLSKPGLVVLGRAAVSGGSDLKRAVARLCAAQYFSGLVGSDPENEPWLRETLSAYMALMYIEETQGHAAYLKILNGDALTSLQVTVPGGLYVDSAASRFTSSDDYILVVRDRGCAVMHELRSLMGREAFLGGMKLYVNENRMKTATIEQFARAMDLSSGQRWDEYIAFELQNVASDINRRVAPFE